MKESTPLTTAHACLNRWNKDSAPNMKDVKGVQELVDELVGS